MEESANKERFIGIFREKIHREGADKLLEWLLSEKCDFFTAPASTRYHGACRGGLLAHSLNVYDCLVDYLARPRIRELLGDVRYSEESVAIAALLHDICKVNFYVESTRNQKNKETGAWESVPYYTIEDQLPYGHGEKSVYVVSGFMHLTRDEALAIRWHMGFSGCEDPGTVGQGYAKCPLAVALSTADLEATYFIEGMQKK